MSADLLAEFDSFYRGTPETSGQAPVASQPAGGDLWGPQNSAPRGSSLLIEADEEDDFGDFETAAAAPTSGLTSSDKPNVSRRNPTLAVRSKPPRQRDDNVLFDVDDEAEEDDSDGGGESNGGFGDFTVAQTTVGPASSLKQTKAAYSQSESLSLIDIDDTPESNTHTSPQPQSRKSPPSGNPVKSKDVKKHPKASFNVPSKSVKPPVQLEEPMPDEDFDAWDEAGETPPTHERMNAPAMASGDQRKATSLNPSRQSHPPTSPLPHLQLDMPIVSDNNSKDSIAPNNIPPPVLLLGLFAPILEKAQKQLFEPLSSTTQDSQYRSQILAQPEVLKFLQALLDVGAVLARITAGRKFRWQRDKALAQSMSIGPASASGKSGGMKLTGLDKAEKAREDREAEDAIRSWKTHVGRLRSTVNAAGKMGSVPDVSESVKVGGVSGVDGGVNAPKPCALCGLKRTERIPKVDVDVEDSFGEWWVDHWGHRVCMNFWLTQKNNLTAR